MRHFNIKQVKPQIFHFIFKDARKCSLHFIRSQECYESNIKGIRNSKFTFLEFIEKYSKKSSIDKHTFTYMNDWGGFNVPDYIFDDLIRLGHASDFHEYDHEMLKAVHECKLKSDGKPFYIIGSTGNYSVLLHEVAHGMWYTDKNYSLEMKSLISSLNKSKVKLFYKKLSNMKYCKNVLPDEMQAYLSTGLVEELEGIFEPSVNLKFKKLFNKHYKK